MEGGERSVGDVADVVEGESQSLKLRQSTQSENRNLCQDVIIQPQVTQRRQAFKGGGWQAGDEVCIQTSGREKIRGDQTLSDSVGRHSVQEIKRQK